MCAETDGECLCVEERERERERERESIRSECENQENSYLVCLDDVMLFT